MDKNVMVNGAEKQRQRNIIKDQIRRFLDRGGKITVLSGPTSGRPLDPSNNWFDNETLQSD